MNAISVSYLLKECHACGNSQRMDDSRYTDAEMESATGLPLLHVRRLITWGAVSLARGGKGVVRQWDRFEIRHIACINALYVAGLSLPMAHTLAMLTPLQMIDIIDPKADIPAQTRKRWFDPQTPLRAREKSDAVVVIVNGYSIFWALGEGKPRFVGKLSADRSTFLSALDHSKFDERNPASLSWEYQPELAADPAQQEVADILQHPVSVNSINLGLAARIAMRRLLGVRVFFS
jgi:hypothetical protein